LFMIKSHFRVMSKKALAIYGGQSSPHKHEELHSISS
jgi:hypothetical protein